MMFGNGLGMGAGWLFGILMMVGVVLLIILLVRLVGGGVTRGGGTRDGDTTEAATDLTAQRILDERYARGDLTTEEYRERLRMLDEGR